MVDFLILKQTNGQNANILEKEEIEDCFPETPLEYVEILKILIDEEVQFTKNHLKNSKFKSCLENNNADLNIETQIITLYLDLSESNSSFEKIEILCLNLLDIVKNI